MSDTPLHYPELPSELSGRISWRALKYFGAGAIIASVTIGSGETLFASRGGAIFGYALLWCFIGGAVMKGIQVYGAARYMTLTGEHPMMHWGLLPGPRNWVPLVIGTLSLLCFPFWLAGLPLMLGKTINWIVGADDPQLLLQHARLWGSACIVIAVVLTWFQTYGVLEKAQTFIVGLLLVSILAALFASRPDWINALVGAVVPTVPDYPKWMHESMDAGIKKIVQRPSWVEIGVYLGAIGGGTYDYIGYIGCYREKAWGAIGRACKGVSSVGTLPIDTSEQNILRGRRWLRPAAIDVGVGFLCVLIFTICFVMLGAQILHPAHLVPKGHDLLTHQAHFLTQFHPALVYFYQLGIFVAFWGTIYGAYELYTRTTYECLRPLSVKLRDVSMRKVRLGVLLYCGGGGLLLLWIAQDPVSLVTPAAIVGGVFTCGLWCFAMVWTDRHFLPPPLRMRSGLLALTIVTGLVLTCLGIKGMWDYVANLL